MYLGRPARECVSSPTRGCAGPPHLEGTLCRGPGVLGQGLLLLLTVRLEQEVVPRVDDCRQGGAKDCLPGGGVGFHTPTPTGLSASLLQFGAGPVTGPSVAPSVGSLRIP